jgi:predicted HicB family RNase H-like nuclease
MSLTDFIVSQMESNPRKQPATKYLKRKKIKAVTLTLRIDQEVKDQADLMSKAHGTSLNRFAEAALNWYMDELTQIEKMAKEDLEQIL